MVAQALRKGKDIDFNSMMLVSIKLPKNATAEHDRNQPILNLALHLLLAPKLSNSPLGRPLSPTGPPGLKYGPNGAPKPVENSSCAA